LKQQHTPGNNYGNSGKMFVGRGKHLVKRSQEMMSEGGADTDGANDHAKRLKSDSIESEASLHTQRTSSLSQVEMEKLFFDDESDNSDDESVGPEEEELEEELEEEVEEEEDEVEDDEEGYEEGDEEEEEEEDVDDNDDDNLMDVFLQDMNDDEDVEGIDMSEDGDFELEDFNVEEIRVAGF